MSNDHSDSRGSVPSWMAPAISLIRDFLIIFPAVNIAIVTLSLILGFSISPVHIGFSFLLCLIVTFFWQERRNIRTYFISLLLLSLLLTSSIILSISMIDIYGDSRSYHGPAVIALADGWNPIHDWQICEWDNIFCMHTTKFIDHYPKGQWYISAEFYSLFNNLDSGKCMNILMLVLCFIVAYETVGPLLQDRRFLSLMVSIAIAANPVTMSQLFSGCVDGILSSTLTIYILLQVQYCSKKRNKYLQQSFLILIYLVNIKYTGLVYATVFSFLLILTISYARKDPKRNLIFFTIVSIATSIVVFGFNPYITNTILEKNPFAQAVSVDSMVSVIDRQADPEFIAKNRFQKFLIATFSVGKRSDVKQPEFSVPLARWELNRGIAIRFGGFGPLFSAIFLVAVFQAARLRDGPSIAVTLCVLITVFSTSACWWPRLAPQTWLVICLLELAVLVTFKGSVDRRTAQVVLAAMTLNSALVFFGVFSHQQRSASKYYRDLRVVRSKGLSVVVTDNRHGLVGFYNRQKLIDSLGDDDLVVDKCETRRQNRIFRICRETQPIQ